MRGRVFSSLCVVVLLIELTFLVVGVPTKESTAWCQPNDVYNKSTPASDARTKECCDKLDKSYNVKMGKTELDTPTDEQDKDGKSIVLIENKPSCTFTAPSDKFKPGFYDCCEEKGMTYSGDGQWWG